MPDDNPVRASDILVGLGFTILAILIVWRLVLWLGPML